MLLLIQDSVKERLLYVHEDAVLACMESKDDRCKII